MATEEKASGTRPLRTCFQVMYGLEALDADDPTRAHLLATFGAAGLEALAFAQRERENLEKQGAIILMQVTMWAGTSPGIEALR